MMAMTIAPAETTPSIYDGLPRATVKMAAPPPTGSGPTSARPSSTSGGS